MKRKIRLTEGDLHNIVKESVNKILNELFDSDKTQNTAGQLAKKAQQKSREYWLNDDPRDERYDKLTKDISNRARKSRVEHGLSDSDFQKGWDKQKEREIRRRNNARK